MNTTATISRKKFLRLATMGAAGLGLAPLQSAMALPKKCDPLDSVGAIQLELIRGPFQVPGEFYPSLVCNVFNRWGEVSWDKGMNSVRIQVEMDNVPYRPTLTRPPGTNAITPFSPVWPETVMNGAYQVWLVSMLPFRYRKYYYDLNTLELLGHDGIVTSPPSDAQILQLPVWARIGSPLYEPNGSGTLRVDWRLDYDNLLDAEGNAGQEFTFSSLNMKTNAGQYKMVNSSIIPWPNALNFDHFLAAYGFAVVVTIEPNPKPSTLTSKANNFVLAGQIAYFPLSDGTYFDAHFETIGSYPNCGDRVGPLREGISL